MLRWLKRMIGITALETQIDFLCKKLREEQECRERLELQVGNRLYGAQADKLRKLTETQGK